MHYIIGNPSYFSEACERPLQSSFGRQIGRQANCLPLCLPLGLCMEIVKASRTSWDEVGMKWAQPSLTINDSDAWGSGQRPSAANQMAPIVMETKLSWTYLSPRAGPLALWVLAAQVLCLWSLQSQSSGGFQAADNLIANTTQHYNIYVILTEKVSMLLLSC